MLGIPVDLLSAESVGITMCCLCIDNTVLEIPLTVFPEVRAVGDGQVVGVGVLSADVSQNDNRALQTARRSRWRRRSNFAVAVKSAAVRESACCRCRNAGAEATNRRLRFKKAKHRWKLLKISKSIFFGRR